MGAMRGDGSREYIDRSENRPDLMKNRPCTFTRLTSIRNTSVVLCLPHVTLKNILPTRKLRGRGKEQGDSVAIHFPRFVFCRCDASFGFRSEIEIRRMLEITIVVIVVPLILQVKFVPLAPACFLVYP